MTHTAQASNPLEDALILVEPVCLAMSDIDADAFLRDRRAMDEDALADRTMSNATSRPGPGGPFAEATPRRRPTPKGLVHPAQARTGRAGPRPAPVKHSVSRDRSRKTRRQSARPYSHNIPNSLRGGSRDTERQPERTAPS
jgi:hypothetical protein